MNITNFLLTGDKHGVFTFLHNAYALDEYEPEKTAIIILGDAGFNFWLNNKDQRLKREVSAKGYTIYCVRGNHEARPQDIDSMIKIYDPDVDGEVYMEEGFPLIRYFMDYGIYNIGGYVCAVIGGAYSVDKYYRLASAGIVDKSDPRYYNPKITRWFHNEQLSTEEMTAAMQYFKGKSVDFIFSHTCPISWEPNDLFLNGIDQSIVDKSMEYWLDDLKNNMSWEVYCFGHFHADRMERPYVEQYYNDIDSINEIYWRWQNYKDGKGLDWWLVKSPYFDN